MRPLKSRVFACLAFLLATAGGAATLAACDSGGGNAQSTPGLQRGQVVFARYCNSCHPGGGKGAGPSLKQLAIGDEEFRQIVREGKKAMPRFDERSISDDELGDLLTYVRTLR